MFGSFSVSRDEMKFIVGNTNIKASLESNKCCYVGICFYDLVKKYYNYTERTECYICFVN